MRKVIFKKSILCMVIWMLWLIPAQADTVEFQKVITQTIDQVNNIRKQFISITESGYKNHVKERSNKENIKLVKLYLDQIDAIKKVLDEYPSEELDVFESRKFKTLLGSVVALREMGDNLIQYLSAIDEKEQYNFFLINLQFNEYILKILSDVKDAPY